MKLTPLLSLVLCTSLLAAEAPAPAGDVFPLPTRTFDVHDFGAKGDGLAVDSTAINKAIDAAAAAGGGIVRLPAGTYQSYTIRLKSNVVLHLDQGAVLFAATVGNGWGYDAAEPNPSSQYQDGGHSHWQNSLIVGIGLENIGITGPGLINGQGLSRGDPGAPGAGGRGGVGGRAGAAGAAGPANAAAGTTAASAGDPAAAGGAGSRGFGQNNAPGQGNKAIGLKDCRHVVLRDFSVADGGHFALLATGVDDFVIDGVKTDTNRDSFDIDCCRRGRITNCQLNSPNDDALVLKSSYALGEMRSCEDLVITHCQVTGYDVGSFFDGTKQRTMVRAPDRDGPTGRIKFGTESNGGFKRITITGCTFDRSRGLALESVDGAIIEDITVSDLTMTDVSNSPIFLRLGNRARGPAGTAVGAIRRVNISNVTATGVDPRYPILLSGLPGHAIEDVTLSNIHVTYQGGITMEQVAQQPSSLVIAVFNRGRGGNTPSGLGGTRAAAMAAAGGTPAGAGGGGPGGGGGRGNLPATQPRDPFTPPEEEGGYPEPSMFGLVPAGGIYARHVQGLTVRNVELSFTQADERTPVVLQDVTGATFDTLRAQRPAGAPAFVLRAVKDFKVQASPGVTDATRPEAGDEKL